VSLDGTEDDASLRRSFATFADVLTARATRSATRDHGYVVVGGDGREEAVASYTEIDARVRALSRRLRARSRPGDRVLLIFPTGIDFIVSFLACLRTGRIAVPLYPPDPKNLEKTLGRFRSLVADAEPRLGLVARDQLRLFQVASLAFAETRRIAWLSPESASEADVDDAPDHQVAADDIAFLQYTSGSTSSPKGVMVTHRNLLANSEVIHGLADHSTNSVYVSWLPVYHDMGLICGLLQPLYMGGRGVVLSPLAFLRRPVRWLEAITRHRGTTSPFPNFALELCMKKVGDDDKARLDLSSWRLACNGAEPIRADTLTRFSAEFARCGFRASAHYPAYGLAESTLLATGGRVDGGARNIRVSRAALADGRVVEVDRDSDDAAGADDASTVVSCGAVAHGHHLAIVDAESSTSLANDRVGEIWLSGPSVARGYWKNDAQTKLAFGASLAEHPGRAFLRTGDLGFVHHGELFVVGRTKDLIIIGGANHHPHDIERAAESGAVRLRPGCTAAFSIDDEDQQRVAVVAEVKERGDANDDASDDANDDAIRAARAAVIDETGLVPWRIVLVAPGSMPKTSSGKLQRHLVKSRYLARALDLLREG
jgi:acyl-CoA synthetase (AMP-forming)/AMP-acid ligase II